MENFIEEENVTYIEEVDDSYEMEYIDSFYSESKREQRIKFLYEYVFLEFRQNNLPIFNPNIFCHLDLEKFARWIDRQG